MLNLSSSTTIKHRTYGFTLVEMSIVLIIIGIILGAVIKGKDLIRSGEQKKIYNNFINEWQIAYQNYFDRTGWILGDVDNADNGAAGGGRDGLIATRPTVANLAAQLIAIGLEVPSAGPSGNQNERNYSDSNGDTRTITLNFNNNAAWGNHMELTSSVGGGADQGLPNDLGMALDNIIDGQRGGDSGNFQLDANRSNGAQNGTAWPAATVAPGGNDGAILQLPF